MYSGKVQVLGWIDDRWIYDFPEEGWGGKEGYKAQNGSPSFYFWQYVYRKSHEIEKNLDHEESVPDDPFASKSDLYPYYKLNLN